MSVVTYRDIALNWSPRNRRDNRFNILAVCMLAGFMLFGWLLGKIEVPEEKRQIKIEVPERVAKFILEKPKPKPKPKKVEPPKPKPKPKPRVERKQPKKIVKLTKKQEVARKKAEKSGLLALSNELSDLIDTSSIDSMVGKKINKSVNAQQTARVDTDKLTSEAGKGSGGVNEKTYIAGVGSTKLTEQERAVARQLITSRAVKTGVHTKDGTTGKNARIGNYRSEEDIAYVMDKNKSKLHALYRRARRHNPGLKGKIVLEITILASGRVSAVRVKSSELNDPTLEARLLARIKQFDFGERNVKTVTVTFPVEFLPS